MWVALLTPAFASGVRRRRLVGWVCRVSVVMPVFATGTGWQGVRSCFGGGVGCLCRLGRLWVGVAPEEPATVCMGFLRGCCNEVHQWYHEEAYKVYHTIFSVYYI